MKTYKLLGSAITEAFPPGTVKMLATRKNDVVKKKDATYVVTYRFLITIPKGVK